MQQIKELKTFLNSDSIVEEVGKFITFSQIDAPQIIKDSLFEMSKNTRIATCSKASIVSCLAQCARYGLSPNSDLGHVYFVPFKDKCTVMLGYKGMLNIAYRSGNLASISAEMIYENDEYDYSTGTDSFLKHKKALVDRGNPIAVYAIAKLTNSETQYKLMTMDEVNKSKDASSGHSLAKSKGYPSIWDKHFDEMAKKSCIRSLFKYLNISNELESAIAEDDKQEPSIDAEFTVDDQQQSPATDDRIGGLHDKIGVMASAVDLPYVPDEQIAS